MSDSPVEPWSDNPNAPRVSTDTHTTDKENFAGYVIGAIAYGIVIILFFQCLEALIDPVNNFRRRIKWWLVAHTVALFLFLTIPAAIDLHIASIEYVDNRNFPGTGPVGYDSDRANFSTALLGVYNVALPLNQCLADGLLLFRCYIIYSKNCWVMVFPCILYVASVVTGIMSPYVDSIPTVNNVTTLDMATAYYSICLSLNVLITLMIIIRLILRGRKNRQGIRVLDETMGLYSAVSTMLVESCALYAAALIIYLVPFALNSPAMAIPSQTIAQFQVIAPYLITLRVAKRRALTSKIITSGSNNVSSIRFASQLTTNGDRSLHDGDPIRSMQANGEAPDEVGLRCGNGIEEVPS